MKLALDAVMDPEIIAVAKRLVLHIVPEHVDHPAQVISELWAVYNFVDQKIRYTRDPERVELIYTVQRIKQLWEQYGRWSGDCDDITLVTATLLMALGHRIRITIASFPKPLTDPKTGKPVLDQGGIIWSMPFEWYSHVFTEAMIPSVGWVVVDTSLGPKVYEMTKRAIQVMHFYPSGRVEKVRLKEANN